MRKLILPLVIVLSFSMQEVFSQATCAAAYTLPINATCSAYPSNTSGSGGGAPVGTVCSGNPGTRRVSWYKFVATTNACYTLNISTAVFTQVALYSVCGTMVANSAVCFSDGQGIWSASPSVTYTTGATYYLRVYTDYPVDASVHDLNICLNSQPSATNDLCSTATRFDLSSPITTNNACAHYTSATEGLSPANANFICATTMQNTVWYSFLVASAGFPATVTITGVNCDSYNNSSQFIQAGLLTGTCGGLAPAVLPAKPVGGPFPTNGGSCAASGGSMTLTTSAAVNQQQRIYLGIDGFSGANCKFTLIGSSNIIPIPIRLESFSAWAYPAANLIRWKTAWEHDNNYFEIERSLDGQNFESIGRMEGVHNSNTDKLYDFEDKNPPSLAYYRLKQVDYDGKYEYSGTVQVKRDQAISRLGVTMPNPASNNTKVSISTEKPGRTSLRIVDVSGRDLFSQQITLDKGNNVILQDFSKLAPGNYYFIVIQDENRVVKPFVKQ